MASSSACLIILKRKQGAPPPKHLKSQGGGLGRKDLFLAEKNVKCSDVSDDIFCVGLEYCSFEVCTSNHD